MSLRSVRLQVEVLEERAAPSSLGAANSMVNPTIAQVSPAAHQVHALAGHGSGTYTYNSLMKGIVIPQRFTGSGHFGQLGDATVTGTINQFYFIPHGQPQGTLTFTNGQGSLTIELKPLHQGPEVMPKWFTYHITSATGSYANVSDHGTLRIDLGAAPIPTGIQPDHIVFGQVTGGFRISI